MNRIAFHVSLISTAVLLSAAYAAAADLKLAPAFSDHMVLQRDKPIVIWGEAAPNAAVDVTLGDAKQEATADAAGHWRLSLKPQPASVEPRVLKVTSAGKDVIVNDVLVGDVWLCAGQSNMQMGLGDAEGGKADAKDVGKLTRLRLLTVPKKPSPQPVTTFDAKWQTCSPGSASTFPAVGFYFGRDLLADPAMAGVPVGLIDVSVGGTAVEAWASKEAVAGFKPTDLMLSLFGIAPSTLYNGMIAPLAPLPVAGALWYQGESNAGKPELYPPLLTAMIADWRKRFDDPALPFLIVQLPAFTDTHFLWIREAQAKVAREVPKVAMAVTIDTTDGFDLHPKEKREIGRRLSLLARRIVLKQDVLAAGPKFKAAAVEGAAIRLTFDTAGDGLASRGAAGVKGFSVAGEDGVYRFADAAIDGDTVVVKSGAVPRPKTARYAWAGIPEATLTNRSGLPVGPFRTDDQPRSNVEVQRRPTARRVATGAYEIEVNGEGKVASLAVHGKQFMSNAVGSAGGTSIPYFFGPRTLADIRAVGPDLLNCSDSDVTLSLTFKEGEMTWAIQNRSKMDNQFRIALAAKVTAGEVKADRPVTLTRGTATLTVNGADSAEDGEDGKVLVVKVKAGSTKTLTLTAGGK